MWCLLPAGNYGIRLIVTYLKIPMIEIESRILKILAEYSLMLMVSAVVFTLIPANGKPNRG